MPDEFRRWRAFRVRRGDVRADVDDELRFHLESAARDLAAHGLSDGEAAREAARQFGDLSAVREACVTIDTTRRRRDARSEWLGDLWVDVRIAARTLRRSPGFTLMATACIALGVGVTTTIFSAVHAILLRPLPYADADRLVAVYSALPRRDIHGSNISWPDYNSWRDENRTFEALGMYTWGDFTISGERDAERVNGALITANLFPLLGVRPLIGRGFTGAEEEPGNDRVILLSHGLWQRRFGGARDIVGQVVRVGGEAYTVVGVMPPRFAFPDRGQAWVPLVPEAWMRERANRGLAGAIGRLKPGVTIEQARADLAVIARRLQREYAQDNFEWEAEAIPLRDDLVGDLRRPLLVFQGAVALVLLIACANVANLLLARGATRHREIAVRVALGAGQRRIVRYVLTECLALALVGGVLGSVLALGGVRLLRLLFPDDVPFYIALGVDGPALAFSAGVTLLTGLLFGLGPALRAGAMAPARVLRDGSRAEVGGGRRASRIRSSLVVAEIALSLVLLIGASLIVRSYRTLSGTDLGFDPHGVLTARVSLVGPRYDSMQARRAFYEAAYARLAALPGVERVGSAQGIPFSGWDVNAWFSIEGRPARRQGEELDVHYQRVSPAYFTAIGVPIARGRNFTAADRDSSARVAIINEELARREFAGEDPVGKRIKEGEASSTEPWITIVGVAGTFRHYRLPRPMGPAIYFPQLAAPARMQTLVIRTSLADPAELAGPLREVLHQLEPDAPPYSVQSLDQAVARSLWRQRMQTEVLGVFASLAFVLALVGVYGVISYAVAQRTREFGVRMALGATGGRVLRLVLAEGARLAGFGVVIGGAAALVATKALSGLLYGVAATDPLTFALVPALLVIIALLATLFPARRATRVDPGVALRAD
jgi:putative ABC transport system permease protein